MEIIEIVSQRGMPLISPNMPRRKWRTGSQFWCGETCCGCHSQSCNESGVMLALQLVGLEFLLSLPINEKVNEKRHETLQDKGYKGFRSPFVLQLMAVPEADGIWIQQEHPNTPIIIMGDFNALEDWKSTKLYLGEVVHDKGQEFKHLAWERPWRSMK